MSDTNEISHSEILNKLKAGCVGLRSMTMQTPLSGMLQFFAIRNSVKEIFDLNINMVGVRDVADVIYRIEDMLKLKAQNKLEQFERTVQSEIEYVNYKKLVGNFAFCIEPLPLGYDYLTKHKLYKIESYDEPSQRFTIKDDYGKPMYAKAKRFLGLSDYLEWLEKNPMDLQSQKNISDEYHAYIKLAEGKK